MTSIITLIWGLLSGLRGTLAQAARPARPRTPRTEPARPESAHRQGESREAMPFDPTAIERAMAELLNLFAQWQAGTLPAQPQAAPRYIPHPSWRPIWLRRRQPTPKPAPRPPRRTGPRTPCVTPPQPATPPLRALRVPTARHHSQPIPPRRAPALQPGPSRLPCARPRTPHRVAPGQGPTLPTH